MMFNSFNNYASTLKAVNQQTVQNNETHVSLSNFAFGSAAGISSPGSTSAASSTSLTSQTKIAYSQGLWWLFYSDGITGAGRDIYYQTSPDGSTWSTPTVVTGSGNSGGGSGYGYDFSIYQSGSTIYYVLVFGNHFYWRYGTMSPAGSISWSIGQTAISISPNSINEYAAIVEDNQGNLYVALNSHNGGTYYIQLWEDPVGTSRTTWSSLINITVTATDSVPILVPTPTGVALVYGSGATTGQVYITYTTFANPSVWSPTVSPSFNYAMDNSSATEIGNTIYFAGVGSATSGTTTGVVRFFSYNIGAASTSNAKTLVSSISSWQVAISQASETLQIFYGEGSNLYQMFSMNLGETFSQPLTVSTTQSSLSGLTGIYAGDAVMWISGTAAPYNVEFYALSTITVVNSSPFPVHLVSLYVYDNTLGVLSHFDTNSTAVGVIGPFDYWVPIEQTVTIPEAVSWTANDNFVITVSTDQGLVASLTMISPA